jgi:hypothetical protein
MALTRQQVEEVLFRRVGPAMYRADMEVTYDGTNPNFADPISWSLQEVGYSLPADITQPADSDVAQVSNANINFFLSLCEWRMVKNILGNLDDTDEKLGPTGMWSSQFAKQMERYIDNLENHLLKEYGWGPSSLSTGTLKIITTQEEVTT